MSRIAYALLCLWVIVPTVQGQSTPFNVVNLAVEAYDIAWSPDGELIAVGADAGIILLDAQLHVINTLTAHTGAVTSVDWSPDASMLVSGSASGDNSIKVWQRHLETDDFVLQESINVPVDRIPELVWSPDSSTIAVLLEQRFPGLVYPVLTLHKLNTEDWSIEQALDQEFIMLRRTILTIAWDATSTYILSGGETHCIREVNNCPEAMLSGAFVANIHTGDILLSFADEAAVSGIAWSPLTEEVVIGNYFGLSFYDDHTGKMLETLETIFSGNLAYDPSGRILAVIGGSSSRLSLINASTREVITEYETAEPLWHFAWHPNGQSILTLSEHGVIEQWDVSPWLE